MTKVPKRHQLVIAVGLIAGLLVGLGPSGTSSAGAASRAANGSPLVVAELLPFSGPISSLIKGVVTGVNLAIKVINSHGGILGHPLTVASQDTAGDVADAVTGWRALQLQNPTFELGPTTLEGSAVVALYDPAKIPDFIFDGSPELDNANYKYVFRGQSSDSEGGTAMAYYAHSIGKERAAFLITNDAAGETLVPSLTSSYEAHGGKIVSKSLLAPDQSDYRAEIEKIFALHPNVIFVHADEQTSGTLFKDMESLNDLNIPLVGDENAVDPKEAASMGYSLASKYLVGTTEASSTNTAVTKYTVLYKKTYAGVPPAFSGTFYDGVNIFALAMVAAKSTDPKVFINFVTKVTNSPGTKCYDYLGCLALLNSGHKINYEGVGGSYNYDKHHNIYSDFDAVGWNKNGTPKPISVIPQAALAKF